MRATTSPPYRALLACALFVLWSLSRLDGQAPDPRSDFLNALGQFSLALDGTLRRRGATVVGRPRCHDCCAVAVERADSEPRARDGRRHRQRRSKARLSHAPGARRAVPGPPSSERRAEGTGGRSCERSHPFGGTSSPVARAHPDDRRHIRRGRGATGRARTEPAGCRANLSPRAAASSTAISRRLGSQLLQRVHHDRDASRGRDTGPFIRLDLVREIPGIDPFFSARLYADGFASLQKGDLSQAIAQLRESARAIR